jgi:hypothetical protein
MFCDNQAALTLATTDNYHARTKHIDIQYHFIRHVVQTGALSLIYCPTDDMVADILTKALLKWKINFHMTALGLHRTCGGVLEIADSEEHPGMESRPPATEIRVHLAMGQTRSRDTSQTIPQ